MIPDLAMPSSSSAPSTLLHRPPLATAITWLLPPALAIAAVGVYFGLIAPPQHHPWFTPPQPKPGQSMSARAMRKGKSVESDVYFRMRLPPEKTRPPSPRAALQRAGGGDPTAGDDDERGGVDGGDDEGAPTTTATTSTTPASAAAAAPFSARPKATIDALWRRHQAQPLADEPEDAAWAQAHRSLIYQLSSLTRERAFAGAPDPMEAGVVEVTCRSVRCELVLSSSYPHELTLLAETLGRVRWGKRSLWRDFSSEARTEESDDDGARQHKVAITVAFTADLPPLAELSLDGAPLIQATAAPTSGAQPGGHGAR